MKTRRPLAAFTAGFIVVLMAGAAMAQVGPFTGSGSRPGVATAAGRRAPDARPAPPLPDAAAAEPAATHAPPVRSTVEAAPDPAEPSPVPAVEEADIPLPDIHGEEPQPADEAADPEEPVDDGTWIEVLYPDPEQVFHEQTVVFEGRAEPGAAVTAGDYEADVNEDGGWRIVLVLTHEGANRATFTATDRQGHIATDSIVVIYEPRPHDWEWSAHQQWEASDDPEPFNVYFGTGRPGAAVHVTSAYGSATTEVDDGGEWEVAVHFSQYPLNEEFRVVVEHLDFRAEFWFVIFGHRADWEWSAHQSYGSCGEELPYDVFYGTGKPGEQVWVGSPFGSGVTEVNDDGHWEVKVEFPEAPLGEPFEVVVEHLDFREVFTFVRTGTDH